jgi:ankyrin repeat protein
MTTTTRRTLLGLLPWLASAVAWAGAYEDFFRAVATDDARTVKGLLGRGFDPNSLNEQGQAGLYLALREGSAQVVEALLQHPDLRVDVANAVGETPLMMAALRGRVNWCQQLLVRGGRVNREGWTPLHYAATGPESKAVALMLDSGAHIDAASPNRTTALMMAARYGPEASVDLLISRGADLRLRNDKGLNAADFARQVGRESLATRLDKLIR